MKLTGIRIKTPPNKTEYFEDEIFNPEGMVIEAVYQNGRTIEIDLEDVSYNDTITLGQTSVTFTFEGKTATQTIKVNKSHVDRIIIENEPNKTEYIEGENFDPTGMKVVAVYPNNREEEVTNYDIINGNNLQEGQTEVTISYEGKTETQDITVRKREEPVVERPNPSNFSNIIERTNKVIGYMYTDGSKDDYVLIYLELDNIKQNQGNDSYEYYYYVSDNAAEKNIDSWVKIENAKIDNNRLSLTVDTRKLTNGTELNDAEELYVYLREVVTKGEEKEETVSKGVKIKTEDVYAQLYIDDKLYTEYSDVSTGEEQEDDDEDPTITDRIFPNTGSKIVFIVTMSIFIFALVKFIKYRKLKDIK